MLGINFVIGKENFRTVYESAKALKEMGVDNVKFEPLVANVKEYHNDIKDIVIEQIDHAIEDCSDDDFKIINNYEDNWEDVVFEAQTVEKCYACRILTVIAANQKVYTCFNRLYVDDAVIGDLRGQSFKDLWFSDETMKKLNVLYPPVDCRHICAYRSRNELLQDYFDVDMKHINFF